MERDEGGADPGVQGVRPREASYDGAAAGAALAYYKELCDLLWGAGTSVGAVLAPANHDGCTMCARGGL